MPFGAVALRPGINAEFTPTLNEAGISSGDLIRFRDMQVEKLGGWDQFYQFAIGSTVRAMHAWEDFNLDTYLGVGALSSLSVINEGVSQTITPQTTTTNETVDFSTTSGSAVVEIVDASITPNTLNSVFIQTQVSVGGLILFGLYPIATVTGADSYTIVADALATGTETNAGAVAEYTTTNGSSSVTVTLPDHGLATGETYYALVETTGGGVTIFGQYAVTALTADTFSIISETPATSGATFSANGDEARLLYYITLGPQSASSGYGLGGYGLGGYGLGIAPPSGAGTPITTTDWTLDNWGQILVACPEGGAIYTWTPGSGFVTASIIEEAPNVNTGIFIAMPQRMIVAYGSCDVTGVQDPLLIRWCAASDFSLWIAASTNQAGRFRIPTGSRIVGALQAPQQGLIWTDLDLWSMQYVQPPLVFGFTKIMTGCGLVGKHAANVLGGTVYWMSQKQFFVKGSGGPQPLPCTVWDVVFQDIDTANLEKVVCAVNSEFNEVTWYYPSASGGTGAIDRYVKFNPVEKAWDTGSVARTAWIDQSVLGSPIGAGADNIIYQHETGYDANGVPMTPFFETGYFVIAEGEEFIVLDMLLPDMKWGTFEGAQTASVQITVTMVDWPNGPERVYGPFTMTTATEFINTRCRGRQAKLKFESSDAGSFWRLGRIRYRFARDGRR
jgi:hypothetical protein